MMNAYNHLLSCQIKPSQQRIAIMEYLLIHRTHPSVEEIYKELSAAMPTLSKTTIYNTLKLFYEQGAVQMLTIAERNVCFDGDTTDHAHFLCTHCGRIYDVPMVSRVEDLAQVEATGYTVTEVHQYYKGICKECQCKETKEEINY